MIMKTDYAYSIIIPHKNIPELLQRCLDSIPIRQDVQIIIVDDNSDPAMVDFERFPGLRRPHTETIFTKEGKGAGYARNIGLERAAGRLLVFADADDFFNYCVHDILDEYKNTGADVVFFKCNSVDSDKYTVADRESRYNSYIDNYKASPLQYEKYIRYKYFAPWGKIISRAVVVKNNIRFDEITKHEDVTFSYSTGFYASKIKVDDRALYCITVRRSSLTYSGFTATQRLEHIDVSGRYKKFLKDKNIKLNETAYIPHLLYFFLHEHGKYKEAARRLIDLGYSKSYIMTSALCFIFQHITIFPVTAAKMILKTIISMENNGATYTINKILQKVEKRLKRAIRKSND
jgi:glycosyltransferase involved in cell wall biosynthesis